MNLGLRYTLNLSEFKYLLSWLCSLYPGVPWADDLCGMPGFLWGHFGPSWNEMHKDRWLRDYQGQDYLPRWTTFYPQW